MTNNYNDARGLKYWEGGIEALLPAIHKTPTSTKMQHFTPISMMLFIQQL